jgi:hypothetical protein
MNRITTHTRVFSDCDVSRAGCDQQHLRRFVWPSQMVGVLP